MSSAMTDAEQCTNSYQLRVRGLVQGVGFRPFVWRLARQHRLSGWVRNDSEGVLIALRSDADTVQQLITQLREHCPPLARVDSISLQPGPAELAERGFAIIASRDGAPHTGIVPDAATCPDCLAEMNDPADHRYRYPFINCTHCGPRLSIIEAIPYDRANTSMAAFTLCPACECEYRDPANRRFHAQPNACPDCGPQLWLEDQQGEINTRQPITAAAQALREGKLLAVKGIGGFHLACDARNADAVARLRERKRRPDKPLAVMATLDDISALCELTAAQRAALQSPAAPIVLLPLREPSGLAAGIAPGQALWGMMLPHSPLHHLLLADFGGPLVMTSGNPSGYPPCIDNDDSKQRLADIADLWLLHDRRIVNRLDDSVLRTLTPALSQGERGQALTPALSQREREQALTPPLSQREREQALTPPLSQGEREQTPAVPLRRARGYVPAPVPLPPGFTQVPPLLALGGELKNSFCLLKDDQAIVSQHIGDLENHPCLQDFQRQLALYQQLYDHRPEALVVDRHPDYLSHQHGQQQAAATGIPLLDVQHHHAHIAACLGDNGWPLDGGAVIGLALDGLGMGDDGELWGGECLLADYRSYTRLARLCPAALPGGAQAMYQPWRNLFARLRQHPVWQQWQHDHVQLPMMQRLNQQPLATLERMIDKAIQAPPSSSSGRLFDAIAAATGLCFDVQSFEGQAATLLEAQATPALLQQCRPYPFAITEQDGLQQLDPMPLWPALLDDLARHVPTAMISARFHRGLADAWASLCIGQARRHGLNTVALSGGVAQNALLSGQLARQLNNAGLTLLQHRQLPANDGGLSYGQALVAAARLSTHKP